MTSNFTAAELRELAAEWNDTHELPADTSKECSRCRTADALREYAGLKEAAPVAWLATKVRRKWNAEGTEQTDETYEQRELLHTARDAEFWASAAIGYTVTSLLALKGDKP